MSDKVLTSLRLNFILVLGVVFLLPLTQVTAEVVWEEDWENPPFDEWIYMGYSYDDLNGFQPDTTADPAVVDGVFKTNSPTDSFGEFLSGANHNSTVAYGTWSFDWVVEPGVEHESYANVIFIINNYPRNNTGLSLSFSNAPGYYLNLQSGSKGPLTPRSINFARTDVGTIVSKVFSTSITGSHHIDVTRSPEGEFKVFLDATDSSTPPIISINDTTTTTSELFSFGSWIGDSAFDNITISDTIDTTYTPTTTTTTTTATIDTTYTPTTTTTTTTAAGGPGFELVVLVFSLSLFFIATRKRRP